MIYFQNFPYKYKANQSTTQLVYAVTHTTHVEYLHIPFGIARYKINIYILSGKSYRQNNENKIIVNDCTPSVQKMR